MSKRRRQHAGRTRRETLVAGFAAMSSLALRPMRPQRAPADALRVAFVGVGGMGAHDLESVSGQPGVHVAALCDVDLVPLDEAAARHPAAKRFTDWRRMLDAIHAEIDGVVVSTPDHMHAAVALAAMSLGKHVYCQKPIAHNLRECRAMADMARRSGVVTQMGTQIHSEEAYRTGVATLRSGAIGRVREAHLWVSRSWAGPAAGRREGADEVPEHLDWDLWLGVAPERPYLDGEYHPRRWRGWRDFGSGTLGDMGCHIFDPVFGGLELGAPTSVVSRGPSHGAETFAPDGDVEYAFEPTARTTEDFRLFWTDGSGAARPRAEKAQLPEGTGLPGAGSFLVGEKGVMLLPHWSLPSFFRNGEPLEVDVEKRPSGDHYGEWVAACRGEGEASTPFDYAGPLTEAVLLGTIAGGFPGQRLAWNSEELSLDDEEASALIGREYRQGWEVPGLER